MKGTSPLTWQNDPAFFDPKPLPKNQWANANDLIRAGRKKEIFTGGEGNILNLFPILVRRIDFVRKKSSDRILARFPFVKMTSEEKESIKENILLIAEKVRDYLYKSDNRSILNWRDVLANCLEREFLPLPIIRCCEDFIRIDLSIVRNFASARGETFIMPVKLTEELAYLAGIINGDGNLQRYTLSIIDYSLQNIQQLKDKFSSIFAQEGRIQFKTPNSPELIITNKWVVRFFSFLTSQPIDARKYDALQEPLLFQKEPLRSYYWGGVMDADGTYTRNNITLTTASKSFAKDFLQFLKSKNIFSTIYERADSTYQVYVPHKYLEIYKSIAICYHPEKILDFLALKEGLSRDAKIFIDFKKDTLINGYFNFRLLEGLHIVGLSNFVREFRKKKDLTKKEFANYLNLSSKTLTEIEENINAIPLKVLEKILLINNYELMPFLELQHTNVKFRMGRAFPIKLDLKPNQKLQEIAQKLLFYKSLIRLVTNSLATKEKIEKKFALTIQENKITHKVLRDFFKTFCLLSKK